MKWPCIYHILNAHRNTVIVLRKWCRANQLPPCEVSCVLALPSKYSVICDHYANHVHFITKAHNFKSHNARVKGALESITGQPPQLQFLQVLTSTLSKNMSFLCKESSYSVSFQLSSTPTSEASNKASACFTKVMFPPFHCCAKVYCFTVDNIVHCKNMRVVLTQLVAI